MTNMDYQIIQGDALEILRSFEPNRFDAVITEPPYSSGGLFMSAKTRSTAEKYTANKHDCPFPSFPGGLQRSAQLDELDCGMVVCLSADHEARFSDLCIH